MSVKLIIYMDHTRMHGQQNIKKKKNLLFQYRGIIVLGSAVHIKH